MCTQTLNSSYEIRIICTGLFKMNGTIKSKLKHQFVICNKLPEMTHYKRVYAKVFYLFRNSTLLMPHTVSSIISCDGNIPGTDF